MKKLYSSALLVLLGAVCVGGGLAYRIGVQKGNFAPNVSAQQISLPSISRIRAQRVAQWNTPLGCSNLQFSPDGSFLAVTTGGANAGLLEVDLRSTRDWKTCATFSGRGTEWSPDSRLLATESDNQGIDIWDVEKNERTVNLSDSTGLDYSGGKGRSGVWGPVVFSADSSKIATFGEDPNTNWKPDATMSHTEAYYVRTTAVKIWDVATGKCLSIVPGPASNDPKNLIRISDDPQEVNFASYDWTPSQYHNSSSVDRNKSGLHATFDSHEAQISRAYDDTVLWRLPKTKSAILSAALSSDARTLAVAHQGHLTIYRLSIS